VDAGPAPEEDSTQRKEGMKGKNTAGGTPIRKNNNEGKK